MIADGLPLLLNLAGLDWTTADAPKQFNTDRQTWKLKKKSISEPSCKENSDGSFILVDKSSLVDKNYLFAKCE